MADTINNLEGNTPNGRSAQSGVRQAGSATFVNPAGEANFGNQDGHPFSDLSPATSGAVETMGPSKSAISNHEGNPNG